MVKDNGMNLNPRRSKFNYFNLSVYTVFVILLVVFSLLSETFLTFSNFYSTLMNGSPLILITCAMTFALLTGIIDLSVGAVGYAAGCLCGILLKKFDMPIPIAFLGGIGIGVAFGLVNSFFIIKIKMNAMLTTLGMMLAIRGIGKIITQDRTILMGPVISAIRRTKIEELGGFPVVLFVVIAIIVLSQIVLRYTMFGRHLVAIGCNEEGAKNCGINVDKVKTISLVICSGICGIAGIVWVITLGSVMTRGLNSYEFLALVAAVLGGTSLFGGRGSFFPGSFMGAVILLFITNGLAIIGTSPYVIPFIRGTIIFMAMYADSLRSSAEQKISMT